MKNYTHRIVSVALICLMLLSIFSGCSKEEKLLVTINDNEYYMDNYLLDMLEEDKLVLDDSCTIKELDAGRSEVIQLNDEYHSSYFVGIYNDSKLTLPIEECKINYIRVRDFYLERGSYVEFDQYSTKSSLKQLTSKLGDHKVSFEKDAATYYFWDDGEFAVYIRLGREKGNIEEVVCGSSSVVIEKMGIKI